MHRVRLAFEIAVMVLSVTVPSVRDHPLARAHDAPGSRVGARVSAASPNEFTVPGGDLPPAGLPALRPGSTNDMEQTVDLMLI